MPAKAGPEKRPERLTWILPEETAERASSKEW